MNFISFLIFLFLFSILSCHPIFDIEHTIECPTFGWCQDLFEQYVKKNSIVFAKHNGEKISYYNKYNVEMPGFGMALKKDQKSAKIKFIYKVNTLHTEMQFIVDTLIGLNDEERKGLIFFIYTYSSPCIVCIEQYHKLNQYEFFLYFSEIYKNNQYFYIFKTNAKNEYKNFDDSFFYPICGAKFEEYKINKKKRLLLIVYLEAINL